MPAPRSLTLVPLVGIPPVRAGDDLTALLVDAARASDVGWQAGDVVVIASKIVSKSEGRFVRLADVEPSGRAVELAALTGKDPRLVELILRESTEVVRARAGVLIVQHRLGFVSANAAVDASNVGADDESVLVLPEDPDASARAIRASLRAAGIDAGVVIADTHGRAFRRGNVGVAIGVAGVPAMVTYEGETDLFGRELVATFVPVADLVASAAGIVSGEGAEAVPAVVIHGLPYPLEADDRSRSDDLVRTRDEDLFRGDAS